MEEPIVYMKQPNEKGAYIDKNGARYDIITCHHTESKEQVQVGTKIEIIDGQEVEVPIYEMQVVINKGWDSFDNLEQAMEAYGLTPLNPEPVIQEEITTEQLEETPQLEQVEVQEHIDLPEELPAEYPSDKAKEIVEQQEPEEEANEVEDEN